MPDVPERADTAALRASRDLLAAFSAAMERWNPAASGDGPRFDLSGMPADALAVTNQMLGEGEVGITIEGQAVVSHPGKRFHRHLARLRVRRRAARRSATGSKRRHCRAW